MQPLKITVSRSGASTIGWAPAAERAMIDSLRWPNATGPRLTRPSPSGPRCARQAVIRATAPTSAVVPSNRSSPARPHMAASLVAVPVAPLGGHDPGVLRPAPARRVHDQAALRRDAGERELGGAAGLPAGGR